MPFGNQLWVLFEGAGIKRARSGALGLRFYDGLAEAVADRFVWKSGIIILVLGVRVPPPLPFITSHEKQAKSQFQGI